MAIGAVAISLPVALFGSVYMTSLNGLLLWQGIAAYALVGFFALSAIFVAAAIETSERNEASVRSRRA